MMADSTLLKSCAMPPASWPTMSIFCDWLIWFSSVRRSVVSSMIDDGGFGVALVLLDRGDEELPPALLGAVEHGLDRRDVALPFRRLVDRRDQKAAVARVHGAEDRLVGRAVRAEALRQLGEAGIGAHHGAAAVHRRDRHRRMVEEAHEADFGGALADRNARRARG